MSVRVFLNLAAFRIANVFLIQSQFDPDEYWQNLEPSYCRVFDEDKDFGEESSCPGLTWEWKRRQQNVDAAIEDEHWAGQFTNALTFGLEGPLRSFVSILPTLIFYSLLKRFRLDSSWMVSRGPLIVNAILVAATTDWCVWYSSHWMRSNTKSGENKGKSNGSSDVVFWCTYCSLTSWFNAYALVRTYSNSLETSLLALSMALVSPEFLSLNDSLPPSKNSMKRAWIAFFIGGICVSIRFTCLTAYIPMGLMLACEKKTVKKTIGYLFRICASGGLLGFLLTVLFDRAMYGVWAIPVLGIVHFNVIQGNGSLYGTHPFHWYFTAGLPALTGMLFPVLLHDFFFAAKSRATRRLWLIVMCYVVTHSTSEHKEFRFLLPILPIICLICGRRIHAFTSVFGESKSYKAMVIGAGVNLIAVLYLGLFHQRASIDVNRTIRKAAVASLKSSGDRVHVHYLMGCHSTPLSSHLHDPLIRFEPWYLDCSPDCRANPYIDCQSDQFSQDPSLFVRRTYLSECRDATTRDDETCSAGFLQSNVIKDIPDYIVSFADDVERMKAELATMKMIEIGRSIHGINGLQIRSSIFVHEGGTTLQMPISLSYEEMIVLHRER